MIRVRMGDLADRETHVKSAKEEAARSCNSVAASVDVMSSAAVKKRIRLVVARALRQRFMWW